MPKGRVEEEVEEAEVEESPWEKLPPVEPDAITDPWEGFRRRL